MPANPFSGDRATLYLVAIIAGITLVVFWQLMVALIFAASIAVVAMPLQERIGKKTGYGVSAVLITALVFVIFVAVIAFAIWLLLQNQDYLESLVSSIISWVAPSESNSWLSTLHLNQTEIAGMLGNRNVLMNQWVESLLRQIPGFGFQLLVFFLSFSIFLYKGKEAYHSLYAILPPELVQPVDRLSMTATDTLYAIYVVQLTIVIVTAILAIPFFYFLGFGHVLFFSTLAGLLKIVPVLGPSILMAFLGVYALSISDYSALLLLIVIGYPVVCAFPDLYIRPILMGRRTCIHPVIMWIGFFGGLYTMGLVGFVLGPLLLALLITGYHILKNEPGPCVLPVPGSKEQ